MLKTEPFGDRLSLHVKKAYSEFPGTSVKYIVAHYKDEISY